MSPSVQWTIVILLGLAIIGAIMYLGRGVQSNVGGSPGVPADRAVSVDVDAA